MNISSGTILYLSGGIQQFQASSSISNAGQIEASNSTSTFSGAYSGAGTMIVNGGTLSVQNATTFQSLTITSGFLSGTANVAVAGTLNWTAGNISGSGEVSVLVSGQLLLSSNSTKQIETRILRLYGPTTWTQNAAFYLSNGAKVYNELGATFDMRGDGGLYVNAGSGNQFVNSGAFLRSTSTGTASTNVDYSSSGSLSITSGAFSSTGPMNITGAADVSTGATIELAGTSTLNASSSLSGGGNATFSGGTTTHFWRLQHRWRDQSTSVRQLCRRGQYSSITHAKRYPTGVGVVTVSQQFDWLAGTMSGSGRTIVDTTAVMNMTSRASAH